MTGALREQALALLFARSGWTQEELATAEKISATHIAKRLRFGRFLAFCSSGTVSQIPPRNLTERRFRGYWEQSDKADALRQLGAMLGREPKARGGEQYKTTGTSTEPVVATLADLGLDKKTSAAPCQRPPDALCTAIGTGARGT